MEGWRPTAPDGGHRTPGLKAPTGSAFAVFPSLGAMAAVVWRRGGGGGGDGEEQIYRDREALYTPADDAPRP